MNRKVIYIYLLVIAVIVQSCNNYLDIQPKGYTIPSKYEDYRQLMNYAQMNKAASNYLTYITDDVIMGGEGSEMNYIDLDPEAKNLYTFAHGDVFADGESDGLWNYSYNRIYTCNTVINNVMKSEGGSDKDKRVLLAEARVARAFEYLVMIGCYAPAYDKNTAATDLGLPLITSNDVGNLNYDRSSVEEVYAFIKQDLDLAIPDLLDQVPHSFRPSKSTAYGFFSRMYLMRGEYDKALESSVNALKVSNALVDLKLYTIDPESGIGRIVDANNVPYLEGKDNPENIYTRYAPSVFELNLSFFASNDLLDTYERDLPSGAVDKRRELWFIDDEFPLYGMSFKGYSTYAPYIRQNLGLNNMEVMLTAAECYARRGTSDDLTQAAKWYNILRDNRIVNNVHASFTNAEDALRKVLDERRREIGFLGANRLVDLKRLNKDPRFAKTIVHKDGFDGANTWILEPNDSRYIMPLPPVVKGFRPDLPDYTR